MLAYLFLKCQTYKKIKTQAKLPKVKNNYTFKTAFTYSAIVAKILI